MGNTKKRRDTNDYVIHNLRKDKLTRNKRSIKKLTKKEIEEHLDVIIIGAGASGLSAAKYLQKNGKKVIVLEGRDRLGGRIHDTYVKGFGKIPLGGAWLHYKGEHHILQNLLDNLKIRYMNDNSLENGDNMIIYDKDGKKLSDSENKKMMDILYKLPSMITKYARKNPKMTLSKCIRNILKKFKLSGDIINSLITRATEHCSLNADLIRCGEYDGWNPNGRFVIDGYRPLIENFAKNIKIYLNSTVIEIEQKEKVTVKTKDGRLFRAEKVISTIPVGVLKTKLVKFKPELPKKKTDALRNMFTGAHEKIFLSFPYVFWNPDVYTFQYSDPKNRGLCTQWQNVSIPSTGKNILYTNLSGPDIKFVSKSDKELENIAMNVLRKIFGKKIPDPDNVYITRWALEPLTRGAAHAHPNLSGSMKDLTTIGEKFGKIHFAGVDTSENVTETVEAAILSGIRVSNEILYD
tara:strand:+ start:597 stop:1985 length:1389 start_codon:yes stop_codon:yes gene_type:complete